MLHDDELLLAASAGLIVLQTLLRKKKKIKRNNLSWEVILQEFKSKELPDMVLVVIFSKLNEKEILYSNGICGDTRNFKIQSLPLSNINISRRRIVHAETNISQFICSLVPWFAFVSLRIISYLKYYVDIIY